MRNKPLNGLITVLLAASMSLATSDIARANIGASSMISENTQSTQLAIQNLASIDNRVTPELLDEAFQELSSSDFSRIQNPDSSVTFQIRDGFSLTLPDQHVSPATTRSVSPKISAGPEEGGFWVEFNSFDQGLIISGSGTALGAAICAIPGVGQAACIVVAAILTVATSAISENRKCPKSVRISYTWEGAYKGDQCVG